MNKNEDNVTNPLTWRENPFSLKIYPSLFVGYPGQVDTLKWCVENRLKISLLIGPTGSGKTTLLLWLRNIFNDEKVILYYITKPPKNHKELANLLVRPFRRTFLERLLSKLLSRELDIYELPEYMNKKLENKAMFLLVDECHEADIHIFEWLRTLADQVDNLHIIMAGLPTLEKILGDRLETLKERVARVIEMTSLNRYETEELIRKRIIFCGGEDIKPFTSSAIDIIFQKTGGFPRGVLKLCEKLIEKAKKSNIYTIDVDFVQNIEKDSEPGISPKFLEKLPQRQQEIITFLSIEDNISPTDIYKKLEQQSYKTEHSGIRSVNNILRRLMQDGLVVRERRGKEYVYKLSPKVKTLLITT